MEKWSKDLGQYQDERETGISNTEQTTEANTRWVAFWVPSCEQRLGSVGGSSDTVAGRARGHRKRGGGREESSVLWSDG